jgi:hypothetical protein
MAVVRDQVPGWPQYRGSMAELTATTKFIIDWDDIDPLYIELFPLAIAGVPQLPELLTGSSVLYADSVFFEPLCGTTGGEFDGSAYPSVYQNALATVDYKTKTYEHNGSNILTRQISISGEFMTLPARALRWAGGGSDNLVTGEDLSAGKVLTSLEHSITAHRVPTPRYSAIRSLIGKVNSVAFEGAAIETLLFIGAELNQEVTAGGSMPWTVSMKFQERFINGNTALNWNYFLRPNTGTWERLQLVNGDPIYNSGAFSAMVA